MSVTDSQRRRLHADLERLLGADSAATMMDLLPPLGWSDLARQPSVDAQFVAVRAEFVAVRGEIAELRADLKGEIAELRAEVHGQARRLAAINAISVVAASMTTAGLVLAAAHFA